MQQSVHIETTSRHITRQQINTLQYKIEIMQKHLMHKMYIIKHQINTLYDKIDIIQYNSNSSTDTYIHTYIHIHHKSNT